MACGGSNGGADSITGFGATTAVWEGLHQVATSNFPDECKSDCVGRYYDPQPGGSPRLDVVSRQAGRLVWLDVMPAPFETREQVLRDIIVLLPRDAKQVDAGVQTECATVQYKSESLAKALRASGLQDTPEFSLNLIDVTLYSGDVLPSGHSPPYTPAVITEAQIHNGHSGSARTNDCGAP